MAVQFKKKLIDRAPYEAASPTVDSWQRRTSASLSFLIICSGL